MQTIKNIKSTHFSTHKIFQIFIALESIERKQSNEFYEAERKTINEKHAFLRCVDLDEKKSREEKYELDKLKTKQRRRLLLRTLTSTDFSESNTRRSKSNEDYSLRDTNEMHSNEIEMSKVIRKPLLKSIKEFSYFDWSKVKLFNKDDVDFFNENNLTKSLDTNNKLQTTNSYKHQHGLNIQNFNESNNTKIKDLPQVITIRFI